MRASASVSRLWSSSSCSPAFSTSPRSESGTPSCTMPSRKSRARPDNGAKFHLQMAKCLFVFGRIPFGHGGAQNVQVGIVAFRLADFDTAATTRPEAFPGPFHVLQNPDKSHHKSH